MARWLGERLQQPYRYKYIVSERDRRLPLDLQSQCGGSKPEANE